MRYSNNPLEGLFDFVRRHSRLFQLFAIAVLIVLLLLCGRMGSVYEAKLQPVHSVQTHSLENAETAFPFLAPTETDRVQEISNAAEVDLSLYPGGVEITAGGEYHLFGELNGTIRICAAEQHVQLFLDNVKVKSPYGPAIYCQEAEKLILTLLPGTENSFTDTGDYDAAAEPEACIYSACDLTVNGSGKLTVNAYYEDAIRSRDLLKLLGGEYTIRCKRTAVHGNDGVLVSGGTYMISSEKYAFRTTKSGIDGRGNLVVCDSNMTIIAGRNAFVTTKADLYITDSVLNQRSIVSLYDVGGEAYVQEGCVQ